MKPSAVQPAQLFRPQSVALPLIKVKDTFTSNVRENTLSYITPNTVIFIVPHRQVRFPGRISTLPAVTLLTFSVPTFCCCLLLGLL